MVARMSVSAFDTSSV